MMIATRRRHRGRLERRFRAVAGILLLCATGSLAASSAGLAPSQTDIRPLLIGSHVPPLTLKASDGSPFDLDAALGRQPTVLIIYRGGW